MTASCLPSVSSSTRSISQYMPIMIRLQAVSVGAEPFNLYTERADVVLQVGVVDLADCEGCQVSVVVWGSWAGGLCVCWEFQREGRVRL